MYVMKRRNVLKNTIKSVFLGFALSTALGQIKINAKKVEQYAVLFNFHDMNDISAVKECAVQRVRLIADMNQAKIVHAVTTFMPADDVDERNFFGVNFYLEKLV